MKHRTSIDASHSPVEAKAFFFETSLVIPSCVVSARNIVVDTNIHAQFFPKDLSQRAAVPQIYPVTMAGALLEVHALLCDDPVESFRSGDGRAEPDLLVRRLLVQHVAVFFGLDFENTSL